MFLRRFYQSALSLSPLLVLGVYSWVLHSSAVVLSLPPRELPLASSVTFVSPW